jgi:hypothetical protein
MYLLLALFLFFILSLFLWFRRKNINKIEWMAIVISLSVILLFLLLAIPFSTGIFFSYYIHLILVLLYGFVVIKTLFSIKKEPFTIKNKLGSWVILSLSIISSIFLICQIAIYFSGYFYKETPVKLSFPFKNGFYMVFYGGNGEGSSLMNYHFNCETFKQAGINASMKYATDIAKLNTFGSNRNSIFPKRLEDYEIFGEKLYSPCNGEVVDVQDGWTDNKIGDKNKPFNTGNTIIIKTNNVYILLGHLKNGSIAVKIGDKVKQGQVIAEVGSSGLSDFPHLHMQAMKGPHWSAEGLPIVFGGKFPVKNSVFIK